MIHYRLVATLTAVMLLGAAVASSFALEQQPLSRAESTNFEETSRYADVLAFFQQLQKQSQLVHLETFGRSVEGRALPLVIIADPPIFHPNQAHASEKPTVFVLANIHAGEVEGKEAVQHLARRAALGDLRPLLQKVNLLIAPIYNADGNERISLENRVRQYGPIGGVGERENRQGLDLNRDFMKLDSPEAQGLIALLNRWDPHLSVDLHTTNGSYHGYHLTYSIPLNPSCDARLTAYHRQTMMPAITEAMLKNHKYRTYYYGNFAPAKDEQGRPARCWRAFSHQPRVGHNYFGLRNRLGILSEAYSYLDFKQRVEVTEAFVEEILKYAAGHGDEIRQLTRQLDSSTIDLGSRAGTFDLGVQYEVRPLPEPVDILVGKVTKVKNPRSGHTMFAVVKDEFKPVKMQDFGAFAVTRSVPVANGYLFANDAGLREVLQKLHGHGVVVEQLTQPLTAEVEQFIIDKVTTAKQRYEGHHEVKLAGAFETKSRTFPAGTLLVRTAQPLGRLAAYLLEPESDDGLVTWNFFDSHLQPGAAFPVFKLMQPLAAPSTRCQPNANLDGKQNAADPQEPGN